MSAYRYRAAASDGSIVVGRLTAADRGSALAALRTKGLYAVEVGVERGSSPGRISARNLATGLASLGALFEAGLPTDKALAAFEDAAPPEWQVAVRFMQGRIQQGGGLADALEAAQAGIPGVVVGIIRAGEAGGSVGTAVARAAQLAESTAQLRSVVTGALAYPAMLGVVGSLSIAVVLGVVLPRFASIVADSGASVPPLAHAALRVGGAIRSGVVPAGLALIGGAAAWQTWTRRAAGLRQWHALLLDMPVVGPLRLMSASSRACAALGSLLESGVPVATALQHTAASCGDACVESRILLARKDVLGGSRLSAALSNRCAVSVTAARLVRSGEDSARVPAMLTHAAHVDQTITAARLTLLVRFIEPTLIVGFAGIVAAVAAALLQAIYAVRPA